MFPETTIGFVNYTEEMIYVLRGLFAHEAIESRPVKFNNMVIWLDADQRIHRKAYPAVERSDGSVEYWEHGIKKQ